MRRDDPPLKRKWALYRSPLGNYMDRFIFRTPWGTLRLHHIKQSDAGTDYHDHPFRFSSYVLTNGYLEHLPGCQCYIRSGVTVGPPKGPCKEYKAGTVLNRKAEDFHRLELRNGPAWTFVITSPYFKSWGFLLDDNTIVPHEEYNVRRY